MEQRHLSEAQRIQESEYSFPYHYLDLVPKFAYRSRIVQSYRVWVCELLAPYRGQRVLDAGCGDGRLSYDLAKQNLRVTGIDYSERAIQFARAFCPAAEFVVGDLTQHRPEKNYDAIILMEVLEHFEPELVARVVSNLSASLDDEGQLIVTVPSIREPLIPKHYQHFTEAKLKATLAPFFEIQAMYGHLRTGLRYRLLQQMLKLDYVFGPLRGRSMLVAPYYGLAERLLRSIERCPPNAAARLIAVCRKARTPSR